jgi:hypothetical protein
MGLSEAPKEEVTFDRSKVRSINWSRYKILTMEEMPEIQLVTFRGTIRDSGAGPRRRMQLCRRQWLQHRLKRPECGRAGYR